MTLGFVGDPAVAAVVQSLNSRPVDFAGIGDSRQVFEGHGWDHGWQHALLTFSEMRATGLVSPNNSNKNNLQVGYKYRETAADFGDLTGTPSSVAAYTAQADKTTFPEAYLGSGSSSGGPFGILLDDDCPVDNTSRLRIEMAYGVFSTTGGSFWPRMRLGVSPYTTKGPGGVEISTHAVEDGERLLNYDLSSDPTRTVALEGGFLIPNYNNVDAPASFHRIRAINLDRTAGFSYTTLLYMGGRSLQDMAETLQDESDTFLTALFSQLRQDQIRLGFDPRIVLTVSSAPNDRNETETSVGPGAVTDGDSGEAYLDNAVALIERLERLWESNGWSLDELYWLWTTGAPLTSSGDSEHAAYRGSVETLCGSRPRVAAIDIPSLVTFQQCQDNAWYKNNTTDTIHYSQAGNEGLCGLMLDTLLSVNVDEASYPTISLPPGFIQGKVSLAPVHGGNAIGIELSSGFGLIGGHLKGRQLYVISGDAQYAFVVSAVVSGAGQQSGVLQLRPALSSETSSPLPKVRDFAVFAPTESVQCFEPFPAH